MKAGILYREKELRLGDAPEPEIGPDQVLVAPRYAGICGSQKILAFGSWLLASNANKVHVTSRITV